MICFVFVRARAPVCIWGAMVVSCGLRICRLCFVSVHLCMCVKTCFAFSMGAVSVAHAVRVCTALSVAPTPPQAMALEGLEHL